MDPLDDCHEQAATTFPGIFEAVCMVVSLSGMATGQERPQAGPQPVTVALPEEGPLAPHHQEPYRRPSDFPIPNGPDTPVDAFP